jgi:NAD(P)-dependent dehydrogenase (short-subunit alcohol dehydrogenase family)
MRISPLSAPPFPLGGATCYLNGAYNVTRSLVGYCMKKKKGCIVNMTSVFGSVGMPGPDQLLHVKGRNHH